MFRHSDGNKNSWEEREKANKAFLSVHHHGRHHRHQPCLHFIKISANLWGFPPSIWQNGGSLNFGIPANLPRLTFASHPRARFVPCCAFLFVPAALFEPFLAGFAALRKVLILPDSHFLWQHKQECCTMLLLGLCLVRFPNLYFGSRLGVQYPKNSKIFLWLLPQPSSGNALV